ncbi:MAG: S16 family serine protease, partial [Anaerolineales bacterium]|nr:S16 family serine protease [Anaerolineales bacterium]
ITTANLLDNIPGPLRDRMEVIELSGYTQDEKRNIAKRHLLPKQLEAHALSDNDLKIDDQAIRMVVRSYTREAGVRNLERKLAAICRGVAKEIVTGKTGTTLVDATNLATYLGPLQFFPETKARTWGPGLATGLAWTPVGGELLFIEAAKMKGKGNLTMTGKLGDVMKESATAALTYIRSHAKELGVDEAIFAKIDLHIHVPEGAIPKDGPSAGITMAASIASAFIRRKVRGDLAMTGEITLRGRVLPIGGLKEKLLAAHRGNIRTVIIPKDNERDLADVPANILKDLEIIFVEHVDEVLKVALLPEEKTEETDRPEGEGAILPIREAVAERTNIPLPGSCS